MPLSQVEKAVLLAGIIFISGLLLFAYATGQLFWTKPAEPIVDKDLTVLFRIYDDTAGSAITSDAVVEFYAPTDNPFARVFTGTPIASASYDTAKSAWTAVLDAGEYYLLVKDAKASPTFYPVLVKVTVRPLTESEWKETGGTVWLRPSTIHVIQRASVSASVASIKAYDESKGEWVTVSDINVTAYDKWQVDFEISVAGLKKALKAGRLYLTDYTGLTYTKAMLDAVSKALAQDLTSEDDGMTGWYVTFPDWSGGEIHHFVVTIEETGTASSGTITLTIVDYYACQNTGLVWWTYWVVSVEVVE